MCADFARIMTAEIEQERKKHPELSYLFISSNPDRMRESMLDGWNPIKREGAGTVGEVRVGDLILAARPMQASEDERRESARRAGGALDAVERKFAADLKNVGGKYLTPLNNAQIMNDPSFKKE